MDDYYDCDTFLSFFGLMQFWLYKHRWWMQVLQSSGELRIPRTSTGNQPANQPCWSYWQLQRWSSRSTSWRPGQAGKSSRTRRLWVSISFFLIKDLRRSMKPLELSIHRTQKSSVFVHLLSTTNQATTVSQKYLLNMYKHNSNLRVTVFNVVICS